MILEKKRMYFKYKVSLTYQFNDEKTPTIITIPIKAYSYETKNQSKDSIVFKGTGSIYSNIIWHKAKEYVEMTNPVSRHLITFKLLSTKLIRVKSVI